MKLFRFIKKIFREAINIFKRKEKDYHPQEYFQILQTLDSNKSRFFQDEHLNRMANDAFERYENARANDKFIYDGSMPKDIWDGIIALERSLEPLKTVQNK